uniref:Uncharacterized protein n=1 Tax=Anopheles albimanus TaxID=7167 RepID=A0A182F966_ANOAL
LHFNYFLLEEPRLRTVFHFISTSYIQAVQPAFVMEHEPKLSISNISFEEAMKQHSMVHDLELHDAAEASHPKSRTSSKRMHHQRRSQRDAMGHDESPSEPHEPMRQTRSRSTNNRAAAARSQSRSRRSASRSRASRGRAR